MEEFYPISHYNTANKNKFKENIKNNKTKQNNRTDELTHSKSETDFTLKRVKEKMKIIRRYLKKKNKLTSKVKYTNSQKRRTGLKKGENLRKLLRKNKLELSQCIENKMDKNLKLFGNSRYNKESPSLFVEDMKKKISSKKMGLIPMPTSKDFENDLYKEPKYIYTMQRNLSMSRRYQYNKNEEYLKSQKDNYNRNNIYYNTVQSWWKKIPKIIKIQKVFKGYSIRKKVKPIYQLYKFMNYFEKFLVNLQLKSVLLNIFIYSIFKGRKKIEGLYISRKRNILSKKFMENIIMIQNNFRCYLAKRKKNYLLRKKRGFIINKISFITKTIYIDQNKMNNNIIKLQNKIKSLNEEKKYVDKNLISKGKGIHYFDKIYISHKNHKVIQFVNLMRHGLQILAFKKKNYIIINKKYISINYLITKDNFRLNNCISKICHLQNVYKAQYKKNKDSIIENECPNEDSSYDDYTTNENISLRNLKYKNKIPKKLCQGLYISKIRKTDDIQEKKHKKIMFHQEGMIITKKRYYNNENQIKKIQKLTKKRYYIDISLQRPLTNNYNFFSNNTNSYEDDFLHSSKSNNYNYLSKIVKYNIENKIKKIQNNYLNHYNDKKDNLKYIYKKEKTKICFISKYSKKNENIKQVNIKFLLLISLFIKKNIQQYIFNFIKGKIKNFEYPFCLNTINRVIKYLNSNEYKGNNVKTLFNNIIESLNSNNAIKKDLILLLDKTQEDNLRNNDIYKKNDQDSLDYIFGFSSFDKNLKNEKFLSVRLNNTNFNNTNIFTITRFIDEEFDNFVKGKYCYKCHLDLNKCKCSKEELNDEMLDLGINDDYNPKNSIKFFEYNKNKESDNFIQGKPKTKGEDDIITKKKLIKNDIRKRELLFIDGNKQKNDLLNSRKKFDALKVKKDKEKLKENILLRYDIENYDI